MSTALQIHGGEETGTALAPIARGAIGLLKPIANVGAMLQAQNEVRAFITELLVEGRDYAVVPGTDRDPRKPPKPSLHKPGAEKVALAFGLSAEFTVEEKEIDHTGEYPWVKRRWEWGERRGEKVWSEEKGVAYGLYRFVVRCDLRHRESGIVVASCIGVCSTMESKYCDRPRDCENTALKMAQKRAFVGATLIAAGLSDEFTQDIEDFKDGANMGRDDAADATDGGAEAPTGPAFTCPKCGGHECWDNRAENAQRVKDGKKPRPDLKCKTRDCDGVVWHYEEPAAAETAEASTDAAPAPAAAKPAREKHLPQMSGFDQYAGKPLGEIPADVLTAIADKLSKRRVVPEQLLAAVRAVIAEGQAQGSLVEEPAPPAPAQPVVTAPGRVQDALELTPRQQAALADEVDDLPF